MPFAPDPLAPTDFDFIIGHWRVLHRRLTQRLVNGTDWEEFEGVSSTVKILGGFGNLEDNLLHFPGGSFRAAAMRSYCPEKRVWSIWWLDGRHPTHLDTPVQGRFEGKVGQFFADDVFEGKAIKVRFTWDASQADAPRWEQAFSADGGLAWETNWTMQFLRATGQA